MITSNSNKSFFLFLGLTLFLTHCKSHQFILNDIRAKEMVKRAFNDSEHNVVNGNRLLLVSKRHAIKFAEKILFDIYGAREIKAQRPYEVFNVENCWLIQGTLRKNWIGGTFLIIIDARNYRVVRISHGK